jgi:hypothetical protein
LIDFIDEVLDPSELSFGSVTISVCVVQRFSPPEIPKENTNLNSNLHQYRYSLDHTHILIIIDL